MRLIPRVKPKLSQGCILSVSFQTLYPVTLPFLCPGWLLVDSFHTLGIQVDKYYLHWALKSVNTSYIGLFGSL